MVSRQSLQRIQGRISAALPAAAFLWPLGVGGDRAAERHEIGLAFGEDLLGVVGLVDRPDRDHRNVHFLLHRLGQVHEVSVRKVGGRDGVFPHFAGPRGDIESVDAGLLEPLGKLDRLLEGDAVFHIVFGAKAVDQREGGSRLFRGCGARSRD